MITSCGRWNAPRLGTTLRGNYLPPHRVPSASCDLGSFSPTPTPPSPHASMLRDPGLREHFRFYTKVRSLSEARVRRSPGLGTNRPLPPSTWQWCRATRPAPLGFSRPLHTWIGGSSYRYLHTLKTIPVACSELCGLMGMLCMYHFIEPPRGWAPYLICPLRLKQCFTKLVQPTACGTHTAQAGFAHGLTQFHMLS